MLVKQIIDAKPQATIHFVTENATISEAAELLSVHRIGALMVFGPDRDIRGVISERDIVRELGRTGSEILRKPVSEIMTRDVISAAPGDSAVSVLQQMTQNRFRHMPIVEGGDVVAVISIGDVVKARIEEVEHENSALTDMIAGHG